MVEENNSLDSFLADGDSAPAPEKSASDIQPQNPQGFTHPKLKKIKRPKIRPMSDVPPAPAKIEPTEQPVDETTHLTETTEDEASLGTSLVTATDAQDLVRESDFNNSYVLDGLPPELDYASEEDGGYEPAYTDNKATLKKLIVTALGCLVVGIFLGGIFFSSKAEEKQGLEGVVLNSDVPQGRARCGLTESSQACIFYIMNWYKQELTGRDFYKLAAQLTGREEYMIETENLRYSTVKIKPGAIVQLNIPALK